MSVSAVTNTFAAYAQQVTGGTSSSASNPNTVAAARDEATESRATTIKEAQAGDPIAKKKLLKLKAQEQQAQAAEAKTAEPGKGTAVDNTA